MKTAKGNAGQAAQESKGSEGVKSGYQYQWTPVSSLLAVAKSEQSNTPQSQNGSATGRAR